MINNSVVRGIGVPNYSNAWESISMTIYTRQNPPIGFYVYAYIRENGFPYYIGKGKNNRSHTKGKGEVRPPKNKSLIIILEQNLKLFSLKIFDDFYLFKVFSIVFF